MAEYRQLADPHPHWNDFPNNLPPNTVIDKITRDHLPPKVQEGIVIDELDNVKTDAEPIILRRYRPDGVDKRLPVLIYMHGGGFITGGLEIDDHMCREITRKLSLIVLSVKYRLAREHPFPVGFEDCLKAIEWVVSSTGQEFLQANLSLGFLLGGTSAGGNFTAGLAHTMLEQGLKPQPTGLLLMASNFCHPDVRPAIYRDRILSVDEVYDAPGLTVKSIKYFAEKYGAPPNDKRYSPLLHDTRKGLAKKAFFQICGWDPRRDEAILYRELLEEEGIETKSKIYKGLPHGFWTTCPGLSESREAIADAVEGVRWLLD